jgi:hypothetical protein
LLTQPVTTQNAQLFLMGEPSTLRACLTQGSTMYSLTRFFPGNDHNPSLYQLLRRLSLAALIGLAACGGGGGGGGTPSDPNGNPVTPGGSAAKVSWVTVERINNRAETVIKTLDTSTGAVQMFQSGLFTEGGVSAARNGTLAYLQDFDDNYEIRMVRADGSPVASFTWAERLTFVLEGARISPDAKYVSFALDRANNSGREEAVYLCNTEGASFCYWFSNLRSPAWLGDGRLIARTSDFSRIYVINPVTRSLNPIGPAIGDVDDLAGTPNSSHIVFSTNSRPNRIKALNLATNAVTTLSTGGTGQYKPLISNDGASLFYLEACCAGGVTNIGVSSTAGALRRTALNLGGAFTGGVDANLVPGAGGGVIGIGDKFYGQF